MKKVFISLFFPESQNLPLKFGVVQKVVIFEHAYSVVTQISVDFSIVIVHQQAITVTVAAIKMLQADFLA